MTTPNESLELVLAIENGDLEESLKVLSNASEKTCLEAVGHLQVTALQLAAWRGWMNLCAKLCERGADVNAIDKIGRCALYYATQGGYLEITELLLRYGASTKTRVHLNCARKDLGTAIPSNVTAGNNLPLPECWGRTCLHQAVRHNHSKIVKILVEAKADVDVKDEKGVTPLLLAGANITSNDAEISKYIEIVDILVSAKAMTNIIHSVTGLTALHHAVTLAVPAATKKLLEGGASVIYQCPSTGSSALHIAASTGHVEVLRMLMDAIHPEQVDIRDKMGCTSLHKASYRGHHECIRMLIDYGGNLAAETKTSVTVIDAIFTHTPRPLSFLTDILDSRVRANTSSARGKDAHITVDFSVLTPRAQLQMEVVLALITTLTKIEELAILQHPLLETFLHLKWSKLRCFFFILVLIHILFVVSLSGYATLLLGNSNWYALRYVLIFSSCVLLAHNIAQLLVRPRYYVKQFETWLSVFSATIALITSACGSENNREIAVDMMAEITTKGSEEPPQWVLHSISLAILFGWMQMMLLIGRFPMWGYYALMFSTVLKNILKVLLAFVCLIVGFVLSFNVLFHGNDQFGDFWRAAVKTVVMMMGEYEYRDLFSSMNGKRAYLPVTSRIVFFIFVMLASIVLTNLMIGLSVSDIQGLQKEGHIRRLLKQAEFMAHLEKLTSYRNFQDNALSQRIRCALYPLRDIPTKIILCKCKGREACGIPAHLQEALFLLAWRNGSNNGRKFGCQSYLAYEREDIRIMKILSNLENELQYIRKLYHPNPVNSKWSTIFVKQRAFCRMKNLQKSKRKQNTGLQ